MRNLYCVMMNLIVLKTIIYFVEFNLILIF